MTTAKPYFGMEGYDFVAYANRDSVPFREFYKIPEAETVGRESLRYKGNPMFIKALADIGWFDAKEKEWLKEGMTWTQIQKHITGASDSSGRCISRLLCDREKLSNCSNSQLTNLRHQGEVQVLLGSMYGGMHVLLYVGVAN